jgi:hypothetical protein
VVLPQLRQVQAVTVLLQVLLVQTVHLELQQHLLVLAVYLKPQAFQAQTVPQVQTVLLQV